ncbi:hypothetical protein BN946_scf184881.g6 [Trametes cinnabarina]|uniref:Uncharacterized protein n=1 Tax=Pycnoporus cinnabarinus TaxID=5643 RepID=A0A060SY45_PYCCI|nr:hypothetical protein BN946_scf184881.g6 [Trametes cinnabarina]
MITSFIVIMAKCIFPQAAGSRKARRGSTAQRQLPGPALPNVVADRHATNAPPRVHFEDGLPQSGALAGSSPSTATGSIILRRTTSRSQPRSDLRAPSPFPAPALPPSQNVSIASGSGTSSSLSLFSDPPSSSSSASVARALLSPPKDVLTRNSPIAETVPFLFKDASVSQALAFFRAARSSASEAAAKSRADQLQALRTTPARASRAHTPMTPPRTGASENGSPYRKRVRTLTAKPRKKQGEERNMTVVSTTWYEAEEIGEGLIETPPDLTAEMAPQEGDLFYHWTALDYQLWLWTKAADGNLFWKPVQDGFTRQDGRRLTLTKVMKMPTWVSAEWYGRTGDK